MTLSHHFFKKIIYCLPLFSLLVCSTSKAYGQAYTSTTLFDPPSPKHEVRAVWLTTIGGLDWPKSYNETMQRQQLCDLLDRLKAANINTILIQTRIRATTIYPSAYEPFDGCITGHPGRQPSYDPLAFAIEECHKRGIEIHCWIVTIPIGKWNGYGCRQLRAKHPNMVKRIADEGFLNPEKAETADYVANICEEIVSRYDTDGIHLDYIRYPETWGKVTNKASARDNITRIVRAVYERVKNKKRWIKISCAPIGKFDDLTRYDSNGWNAYSRVHQDVQSWIKEGLVDMIFPMMYFRGNNFYPFALDWQENSEGRMVVPGLGIYFLSAKEKNWSLKEISREMEFCRNQNMGYAMFRNEHFIDNTKQIYDYAKNYFNRQPALVPPMTWESQHTPTPPENLNITVGDVITATWEAEAGHYYNVYASHSYPIDITEAGNLIAARTPYNSISLKMSSQPENNNLYFAITKTNRFGHESIPTTNYLANKNTENFIGKNLILKVYKENRINLKQFSHIADFEYVIVCNLSNQSITTLRCDSNYDIDISTLADGMYILRSVNKKGKSHILGYFLNDNRLKYILYQGNNLLNI